MAIDVVHLCTETVSLPLVTHLIHNLLCFHILWENHYCIHRCMYICTVSFRSIHFHLQLAVVSKRTIISVLRNPHAYIMQVRRALTHTHQFTACMVV